MERKPLLDMPDVVEAIQVERRSEGSTYKATKTQAGFTAKFRRVANRLLKTKKGTAFALVTVFLLILAFTKTNISYVTAVEFHLYDVPMERQVHIVGVAATSIITKSYTGDAELNIKYGDNITTISLNVKKGDIYDVVPYELFYQGNGYYDFELICRGAKANERLRLVKTVKWIDLSAVGLDNDEELYIAFDLKGEPFGDSLVFEGIFGSGEIKIWNITGQQTATQTLLLTISYNISGEKLKYVVDGSPGSTEYSSGGFGIVVDYSQLFGPEEKGERTCRADITFVNGLPQHTKIQANASREFVVILS